ncbi:MAG: TonB-dependent receptor plug domain-containing protein [Rikenellaceae bacterium]
MKRLVLIILTLFSTTALFANGEPQIDTLVSVDQISVSTIKQGLNLYRQPVASTILSTKDIERKGVTAIKDISTTVPNLHIPDYGSRTTSSIYIRGLGARIDQPVMGLNIDNVPYLNKNGFDTEVMDIERVEVLRGPQSTLYGRNTMGGVMNIYTLSPFNYQGVKIGAEYSSGNTYSLRASIYNLHSEKLATAISIYHNSTDGFFENSYTGELCDWEKSFGARLKVAYRGHNGLRVENTTAASTLEQGGYAYRLMDSDEVNYNDPSSYDRFVLSNGTTIKYQGKGYSLSSITSYQYLNDDMLLDNDFTAYDYFTLQQKITEHSITEDIVYRSENDSPYNYLFGIFSFFKHQYMEAPVTFREYGIDQLILTSANQYLGSQYYDWDEDEFVLNSDFITQTYGAAAYHESDFQSGNWKIAAGARIDYEKSSLKYHNYCTTSSSLYNAMDEKQATVAVDINTIDNTSLSYFEILPKVNVQYRVGHYKQSSLYASISKGYKAGGFNTQIFSDILQTKVKEEFNIPNTSTYDTEEIITYKPEHSWNYEIGSHIETPSGSLIVNTSLFYIDCRNQQLTVFPEGETTGRMMTNAGRSRSYGIEASVAAALSEQIRFNASYGYTNAKFIDYVSGEDDYAGMYVPYAPQNTFFAEINYSLPVNSSWADKVIFSINDSGAGKIYWNEENTRSQSLYTLLGSSIRLEHNRYSLSLWGKNLLNEEYNTFYFLSMDKEFVQCGRPRTIGATLTINL